MHSGSFLSFNQSLSCAVLGRYTCTPNGCNAKRSFDQRTLSATQPIRCMSPFSRPQLGQARGVICSALDCAFSGHAFPKLVEGRAHHEGARESAKEAGSASIPLLHTLVDCAR